MTTFPDGEWNWAPEASYPADPEFYRRVLHHMPTPLLVVDGIGEILYVNQAMLSLGGWSIEHSQRNVLDHIHPDDQDVMAQAFGEIVGSPGARVLGTGRQWAETYFRIITEEGTSVPVELVGNGGLLDPDVGGIIYELRPARVRSLLGRVLDGLSQGASMHQLLSLIATMIASPPLDLDAVILRSTTSGTWAIAASTSPTLTDVFKSESAGLPWHDATHQPVHANIEHLPGDVTKRLRNAGFQDLWLIAVSSPLTANTLRIIAASPTHHVPATGPKSRLVHARQLAAAVLSRSETDVLLDHATTHDPMTDLPNRAGFHQQAASCDTFVNRAVIHLDLEGLKQVNADRGEVTGDAALQIVADRLRVTCSADDIIGRIGGNEFAILLFHETSETELMNRSVALAKEILAAVHDDIVVAGRPVRISTSIGVAVAVAGISTDHLLTWADAAMHDAKVAGGGQICRYGVTFG